MEKISEKLFDIVIENGVLSSRENVMDEFTLDKIENKVFVKKLQVDIPTSGTTVKMISVAANNDDLSDARPEDVRVGCMNSNRKWTNVYAEELSEDIKKDILSHFSK